MIFRIIEIILLIILVFIRKGIQIRISKKSHKEYRVNEICFFRLGGYKQKVLFEGRNEEMPILIALHGGPMLSVLEGFGYRGFFEDISDICIMVHWDQYGCGINYTKNTSSLKMNDYIVMLKDLIQCIKVKFPCNKIYVSGYSLGSIIALEALYLIQDDVEAFLAIGPVTSIRDSKKNLIQQLEDVKLSNRKRRIVDRYEKYDDMEHYLELERIAIFQTKAMLFRKKGITYRKTLQCAFRILFSPDYNILDVWHCFSQCFRKKRMKKLLDTLYEIDTKEKIKNIRCPLYLLQGETDPYSDQLFLQKAADENENITYLKMQETGHIPSDDAWNVIIETYRKVINKKQMKKP